MTTRLLGSWLRQKRELLNLSQEELAARLQLAGLSVTRATVSHWETGRVPSPLDEATALKAISEALDVSVDEILEEIGIHTTTDHLSPREREAIRAWRQGNKAEAAKVILNS